MRSFIELSDPYVVHEEVDELIEAIISHAESMLIDATDFSPAARKEIIRRALVKLNERA